MLGIVAYLSVILSVGVVTLNEEALARERTVDESKHQRLVERFIAAYNSFDIESMASLLAVDIRFENYSGDILTAAATGIDEFRQLAEQSKLYSRIENNALLPSNFVRARS